VPNTPCGWDKKNSKDSPSLSCVDTQSVVATGKYSVIYTDSDGKPWTIGEKDGKYGKVHAASVFMGTEPAGGFVGLFERLQDCATAGAAGACM
jgi:hypothetical protein